MSKDIEDRMLQLLDGHDWVEVLVYLELGPDGKPRFTAAVAMDQEQGLIPDIVGTTWSGSAGEAIEVAERERKDAINAG